MMTLLFILWGVLAVCLLGVAAIKPERTKHSLFELRRRADEKAIRRERLLGDILALLRATEFFLIVLLSVLAWILWEAKGIVFVVATLFVVILLRRWRPVGRYAMSAYKLQEERLLHFVEQFSWIGWLLGSDRRTRNDLPLESQEQLLHLVESAGHILSDDQRRLFKRGMDWHTTEIRTVMTAAGDIVSVPKGELLGPLVLNDLHESGHNRFPVVQGGVDNILGQINISELIEVDAGKKSETSEKAMTSLDVRLYPDTPLPEALRQLLDHPGQLGIVVNEDGKTEGLFTLRDVLGSLLGKRF